MIKECNKSTFINAYFKNLQVQWRTTQRDHALSNRAPQATGTAQDPSRKPNRKFVPTKPRICQSINSQTKPNQIEVDAVPVLNPQESGDREKDILPPSHFDSPVSFFTQFKKK